LHNVPVLTAFASAHFLPTAVFSSNFTARLEMNCYACGTGKGSVLKGKVYLRTGQECADGDFFTFGAKWGWVVNATSWPLCPQEGYPVPIVQAAGLDPRGGLDA
jgi:hypothetical protein